MSSLTSYFKSTVLWYFISNYVSWLTASPWEGKLACSVKFVFSFFEGLSDLDLTLLIREKNFGIEWEVTTSSVVVHPHPMKWDHLRSAKFFFPLSTLSPEVASSHWVRMGHSMRWWLSIRWSNHVGRCDRSIKGFLKGDTCLCSFIYILLML